MTTDHCTTTAGRHQQQRHHLPLPNIAATSSLASSSSSSLSSTPPPLPLSRPSNSSLSTSPLRQQVFQEAPNILTIVLKIFQGKNNYKQKIKMTAPVITEVSPSDGPFCESSFVVSFFVAKENQANHPPAKGLHVQRWETVYVAVRQFGGFVSDSNVGEEAAALQASIANTKWSAAIEKSHRAGHASVILWHSTMPLLNMIIG